MHEFEKSLASSLANMKRLPLEHIIKEAFPDFHSLVDLSYDIDMQRKGTDYIIKRNNNTSLYLECKEDRHWSERFPFEIWSVWKDKGHPQYHWPYSKPIPDRCSVGWCVKENISDYFLYIFLKKKKAWIMDMKALQRVLRENFETWMSLAIRKTNIRRWRYAPADNRGYETWNLCVSLIDVWDMIPGIREIDHGKWTDDGSWHE